MSDRLTYDIPNPTIEARDPERGLVLLGGLGVLGVGVMWFPDDRYRDDPRYACAPLADSTLTTVSWEQIR